MEKIKPITISFKKNEQDKELYRWISSKSNFSGFIKDILRAKMEEDTTNIKIGVTEEKAINDSKGLMDLSDF